MEVHKAFKEALVVHLEVDPSRSQAALADLSGVSRAVPMPYTAKHTVVHPLFLAAVPILSPSEEMLAPHSAVWVQQALVELVFCRICSVALVAKGVRFLVALGEGLMAFLEGVLTVEILDPLPTQDPEVLHQVD